MVKEKNSEEKSRREKRKEARFGKKAHKHQAWLKHQSIARGTTSQIISEEVLASCSGGPRGNEQYAAVFGAFVAGMACLVGIDFSAKLMVSLALCFEDEYHKEDTLSLRNLTLLLPYLYIFGVCSSELIYDFLIMLSKRLTEIDVSTILTTLQCCGMKIRSDDPSAMKNFIISIQNRVNELKASSGDGQQNINSKRCCKVHWFTPWRMIVLATSASSVRSTLLATSMSYIGSTNAYHFGER